MINRLLAKSIPEPMSGCWIWIGAQVPRGYGTIERLRTTKGIRGGTISAHRASWIAFRGEIPPNLVVDHKCRNRACINPDHLQLVTLRENILLGIGKAAMLARQTHCKRGHEFTTINTRVYRRGPLRRERSCRTCIRAFKRLRRAKLKHADDNPVV